MNILDAKIAEGFIYGSVNISCFTVRWKYIKTDENDYVNALRNLIGNLDGYEFELSWNIGNVYIYKFIAIIIKLIPRKKWTIFKSIKLIE